ncbi:MAG: hypothetical protein DMG13_30470 [Acidobacteria bacterium]|nr:MAG: hypothetical protein DMG13_30470 [Acidobacteriota bacterium]
MVLPSTSAALQTASVSDIIDAAIGSHRVYGNPGEFKLLHFGAHEFSIVPFRVRDGTGRMVEQRSPLDVRIRFSEEERSLEETVDLIRQAVQAETKVPIIKGDLSTGIWLRAVQMEYRTPSGGLQLRALSWPRQ